MRSIRFSLAAMLLTAAAFTACKTTDDPPSIPSLTLSGETLNFGSSGAVQIFTVTCNTKWNVSSDQGWCTLSSAGGNGNATVTITVKTNATTSQRTATITVTTTSGTPPPKTITVSQAPQGGLADRITIEGSGTNAKLVLTTDPTDAGLFFKFGSVVGIYSGNHANTMLPASGITDDFDSGDVAFNSTATAAYSNWDAVPYANGGEIEHTLASVKAGKGDPCRLIGYTVQQIKDATVVPDNKTWRLPTNAENQAFSGQTSNVNTTVHWWDLAGGTNPSPFSGVAGGEFPSRGNGGAGKFLPAAGYRHPTTGTVTNQGSSGIYWSSTPYGGPDSYYLNFSGTLIQPGNRNHQSFGLSMRCVRE